MVREISTLMVWDMVVPSAAPAGPSSYAAENRADDVVGCDKRDAEKTDGQVADSTADSFLWGGHDSHNGFYKTEQDCGQGNGQQHEQRCCIADSKIDLSAVLCAHSPSGHNCGAHG